MEITSIFIAILMKTRSLLKKCVCGTMHDATWRRTVARNSWYCWLSRFLLLKFKCNAWHLLWFSAQNETRSFVTFCLHIRTCHSGIPQRILLGFIVLLYRSFLYAVSDLGTLSSNCQKQQHLHLLLLWLLLLVNSPPSITTNLYFLVPRKNHHGDS